MPGKDINNILAVTTADVMKVYNKYIKNKNYVATSFVPKGKIELALDGSTKADVVEEAIVQGAEDKVDPSVNATYTPTPSTFDRKKEPAYGKTPQVKMPAMWNDKLANGTGIAGIESNEVPLVQMQLVINGGLLLEDKNKVGVSNLMAKMLLQGTAKKTPEQRRPPELGSDKDFPLLQAINQLKGRPVIVSKTAVVENKNEKKEN